MFQLIELLGKKEHDQHRGVARGAAGIYGMRLPTYRVHDDFTTQGGKQ